ncbi:acylphosphatase [Conyzicola sp.]|uniref:acylphosphatase n=1 Tax=Conyzicola sp. TaxID=1969404 RepID=UPI003988D738
MTADVRRRAIVSGLVQGVGFRWSARSVAQELGVSGFARNRPDDTVEVEAEGAPVSVDRFLDWLRHGPPSASVSGVEITDVATTGSTRFDVG